MPARLATATDVRPGPGAAGRRGTAAGPAGGRAGGRSRSAPRSRRPGRAGQAGAHRDGLDQPALGERRREPARPRDGEDASDRPAAAVRAAQHEQPREQQDEPGQDVGDAAALADRDDDVAVAHLQRDDDGGDHQPGQRGEGQRHVPAPAGVPAGRVGGAGEGAGLGWGRGSRRARRLDLRGRARRGARGPLGRGSHAHDRGRSGGRLSPRRRPVPVPIRVPGGRDNAGTATGRAALPARDARRAGFCPCHRPTA